MTYEELSKYLEYHDMEDQVFVPNEIFDDLQGSISTKIHIPVAYSYYYLITWLYRYCKYIPKAINTKQIKRILGYNPETRGIDYLFKKNGLLDTIGYTESQSDFPILWDLDTGRLEFDYYRENKDIYPTDYHVGKRYTVKYPIKAFHRTQEDVDDNYENGTFFEVDNTHLVNFEVFMYCMTNPEIGCTGFYIYSYIKMKSQLYGGKYDCPMHQLAFELGLPDRTMKDCLSKLRQYNVLEGKHNMEFFCTALEDYKRKANSYIPNNIEDFNNIAKPYEKIKIMEASEYIKLQQEQENDEDPFPIELLPF